MVSNLCKDPQEILDSLDTIDASAIHMAMGIAGEAGEVLDAIKKYTMYGKTYDLTHIIEEMGDIEFYMEGLRQTLGLDREEILQANMDKLGKRYASGYSNEAAIARVDKAGEDS